VVMVWLAGVQRMLERVGRNGDGEVEWLKSRNLSAGSSLSAIGVASLRSLCYWGVKFISLLCESKS
jgi:hypothetical protein